jgi:hypothetical protein
MHALQLACMWRCMAQSAQGVTWHQVMARTGAREAAVVGRLLAGAAAGRARRGLCLEAVAHALPPLVVLHVRARHARAPVLRSSMHACMLEDFTATE